MKKLKIKSLIITAVAVLSLLFTAPLTAFAASGNWTSGSATDFNGLSEVGTVNRAGSTTFTLAVKLNNNTNVGSKKVTIAKGAKDYHDCWGGIGTQRHGYVQTTSKSHDPWFNA